MMSRGDDDRGTAGARHPPHAPADALPGDASPRGTAAELEQALAAGRVGAWHLDLASGVLTASAMCKANFGLPPDAALSVESGMALVHENDRPLVQRALDDALAGATEYDIEHRVVWPDGSIHWLHARGRVAGEGQPRCLHGVSVDITRPRRAEALALAQNALLERVAQGHPRVECLRAVNDTIAALDPHVRGCFVFTDARRTRVVEAVAPFPPDAVTQLLAMPLDNASFGTCCAAICHNRPFASPDIAQDEAWKAEWRALCLGNGVRATYSVPVLRPHDGVAIGSFCVCLDEARPPQEWETQVAVFGAQLASTLVERDRVLEALHAGEAQLASELTDARTLHEVSVELVAEDDVAVIYEKIVDAACTIMHSQCASLQMRHGRDRLQLLSHRGFTPKAAQGWQWVEAGCATSCGQALGTGRRIAYSDVRTMVDELGAALVETYRDTGIVAMQTTPLKSRSGRVVGMLSTHWAYPHHPSEHELRLLDILARLAADVIERRQADFELREGDRRKDEFLAMLGHELRNPLAPLCNALHLLRMEGAASADDRALYDMMDRQLTQLVRLVDDLLEVSRITRGHIELRRRHSALSDIVTTAVETSRPLLDAFGHRFTIELPDEPVVLDVDPIRIAQVLSNLLNNAARYTPAGGNIALRARTIGKTLRIGVIDDGAGVDPRQQAEIFELFAQGGQHSRHQARGGLGIGLTLSRNLVLLHGGTVAVQSEGIGKGSEFMVDLPLSDADAAVHAPPQRIVPSERSRRILIVDDNSAHADSLAELLSLGGHKAHTVYDGDDALSVFEAVAPDIVLLDLGMPGMDGCELCRRLRALPTGRDILIIAVTGWGQQADRSRTAAFGFDAHLVKPVNPLEILQRLETA